MKNLIFSAVCLLSVTLCFATTFNAFDFTCPPPQNVTKIAETSSSISFDWADCFCPNQTFEVYYVKDGKASAVYPVSTSGFTFTNLDAGVYEFHFRTTCGSGVSVDVIIEEDIVIT